MLSRQPAFTGNHPVPGTVWVSITISHLIIQTSPVLWQLLPPPFSRWDNWGPEWSEAPDLCELGPELPLCLLSVPLGGWRSRGQGWHWNFSSYFPISTGGTSFQNHHPQSWLQPLPFIKCRYCPMTLQTSNHPFRNLGYRNQNYILLSNVIYRNSAIIVTIYENI